MFLSILIEKRGKIYTFSKSIHKLCQQRTPEYRQKYRQKIPGKWAENFETQKIRSKFSKNLNFTQFLKKYPMFFTLNLRSLIS